MKYLEKSVFVYILLCTSLYSSQDKLLESITLLNNQLRTLGETVQPSKPTPKTSAGVKKDDLLEELEKLLKNFPPNQKRYFTKDEDGEKAKAIIMDALKRIATKFNAVLSKFGRPLSKIDPSPNSYLSFYYNISIEELKKSIEMGDEPGSPLRIFTGKRYPVSAELSGLGQSLFKKEPKPTADDISRLNEYTSLYKIHLMPFKDDIPKIMYELLKAVHKDTKLKKTIYDVKVGIMNPSPGLSARPPTIVIYPANGKETAQFVLDKIYELFSDIEGLDIPPGFNEQVTSLIYFAQGDRDDKITYAYLFEDGDDSGNGRIYYRRNITGTSQDYHLKNPNPEKRVKNV